LISRKRRASTLIRCLRTRGLEFGDGIMIHLAFEAIHKSLSVVDPLDPQEANTNVQKRKVISPFPAP
jgi:hypothetical protein